ncbi:MAG: C4-dicarboxylate ABC transporter [Hydrogenophilales bacterium CG17_big_fil_post_rev_8_21_14_2_50_63_12]|nr:MAG: C4-dicarboxylate ABC transporter [Hydrogenophilales bacterium CG17_big_fil_post_rev_8_21_14_2_50_63_12]PIX96667.1 MAG: C4-dicarboxylate ABC transporter [Hydrogenophilales bacterium CG_4_10_14_3_um_filter_63_21]PJB03539.1 MAG: C4-dicarboxylate ABC transporter [Hydrogenophilales bacterium CG_4_9_14_3_um_filter_63_34]
MATPARLQHFPVAWFAMIMGLGGLTIAWLRTEEILALSFSISPWLLGLTTGLFIVLMVGYSIKVVKYRGEAAAEWLHPVKMNFVPTISIALILLSIAWLPFSAPYSKLLWLSGTALHLVLTLHVITQWMHRTQFEIAHLNPAWFIPVVGNILIPIAGVQHAPAEISWFFFSIGIVFWPVLLAIIFNRVIFHGSLPERLMPTLFILIAPPAVGFLSYVKLTGEVDAFARILYYAALFFTILLIGQVRWFARLKFYLSWWAYSFPLAAITISSLVMFKHTGNPLFLRLSGILLAITTVVIAALFIRTGIAVARRDICVAE